jgi:glycine cleavage system H protein
MYPQDLRYMPSHEWARLEGDVCTIGISQFATEQLTDIVYVELPHVGDHVFAGQSFGEIESVKSVNDLYSPVNGEVIEVNEAVVNDPSIISTDPYVKGWMLKIKVESTKLTGLLTAEQYAKQVASQGH